MLALLGLLGCSEYACDGQRLFLHCTTPPSPRPPPYSLQTFRTPCCTAITCQSCRATSPAVLQQIRNWGQKRFPGRICWTWTSHPSGQRSSCCVESFSMSFTNALNCDLSSGLLESPHCSALNRQAALWTLYVCHVTALLCV